MRLDENPDLTVRERYVNKLRRGKSFALAILAILICLVPSSTAFGYAYYSDVWIDDSDPANIRLVGSGVTQDPDNGYMGTPPWLRPNTLLLGDDNDNKS